MAKLNTNVLAGACVYEKTVLANGLTVIVTPMPAFTGVHAVYGTNFGSADRDFALNGTNYHLPAGVAHFLEHKMFENEEGDAFTLYAKTGANANAYTGFSKTCYVFTASDNVAQNLDILLSFVSRPHFTKETVAKEQGIIGQEIKMYEDAPEWRIMTGLFQGLYHNHPVRDDIAGTVESIAEITPEMLYACTDAFYCPQNMVLSVAGHITMEEVLAACRRAGIPEKPLTVHRAPVEEPMTINKPFTELKMSVSKPMLGVGFKEVPLTGSTCRGEYIAEIITELICGSTTPLYRRLYDESLVSGDFGGEYFSMPGCFSILFSGETSAPEKVRTLLLAEIARLKKEGIDENLFRLCKNTLYGSLVRSLDNIENVAAGQLDDYFKGYSLLEEMDVLAALTKADVEAALANMLCAERSATVIVRGEA